MALAPEPGLGVAVDKERTLEAARGLGLTAPRGALIADHRRRPPRSARPDFRPWSSRSGRGWRRMTAPPDSRPTGAMDAAAVARAVEAVTAAGGRALVQEWLPGRREAVSLLYAHDRVWARFAQVAHVRRRASGGPRNGISAGAPPSGRRPRPRRRRPEVWLARLRDVREWWRSHGGRRSNRATTASKTRPLSRTECPPAPSGSQKRSTPAAAGGSDPLTAGGCGCR